MTYVQSQVHINLHDEEKMQPSQESLSFLVSTDLKLLPFLDLSIHALSMLQMSENSLSNWDWEA